MEYNNQSNDDIWQCVRNSLFFVFYLNHWINYFSRKDQGSKIEKLALQPSKPIKIRRDGTFLSQFFAKNYQCFVYDYYSFYLLQFPFVLP